MWTYMFISLIYLYIHLVRGQYGSYTATPTLYAPLKPTVAPNPQGEFLAPVGSGANKFTEGSAMNVSWVSIYDNVNLWLIVNGKFDDPVSLAMNYVETSYLWTIDCHGSCHYQFVLHIVDAEGTEQELTSEGIWSRRFWIQPEGVQGNSEAAQPQAATSTPPESGSHLVPSSFDAATSSSPSTPSPNPTPDSSQKPSKTSVPKQETANKADPNVKHTSVGIGVGVGIGVAILGVGGFFLWRYYHKKTTDNYSRPNSNFENGSVGWQEPHVTYHKNAPQSGPAELGRTDPVEVEGREAKRLYQYHDLRHPPTPQELPERPH